MINWAPPSLFRTVSLAPVSTVRTIRIPETGSANLPNTG